MLNMAPGKDWLSSRNTILLSSSLPRNFYLYFKKIQFKKSFMLCTHLCNVCLHAVICVCTHACRGQRWMISIFLNYFSMFLWDRVSHWTWILLAPPLHLPSTGDYKQTSPHMAFYIGAGYSNSGSHACSRSSLPTETSPPHCYTFS